MINLKRIKAKQKLGLPLTPEEQTSLYVYEKILTKETQENEKDTVWNWTSIYIK